MSVHGGRKDGTGSPCRGILGFHEHPRQGLGPLLQHGLRDGHPRAAGGAFRKRHRAGAPAGTPRAGEVSAHAAGARRVRRRGPERHRGKLASPPPVHVDLGQDHAKQASPARGLGVSTAAAWRCAAATTRSPGSPPGPSTTAPRSRTSFPCASTPSTTGWRHRKGSSPRSWSAGHPVLEGIEGPWPALLGLNELTMKEDGTLLARAGQHPLLAVAQRGKGRTLAWASDIGPHWCPLEFTGWSGYARLWKNAIHWLAGGTR